MTKNHYIIGAGGVGSWLAPSLCLLVGKKNVTIIDGDKLEEKNLNRQLFTDRQIGHNKASALSATYDCRCGMEYYTFGNIQHSPSDWIFCCVDNNPARLAVLRACDHFGCKAIFMTNETTSSEAYFYMPRWSGSELDPRIYYPGIITDTAFDPLRPESCTGEYQKQNPQLVSANFQAAALGQSLYVLWGMKASSITKETLPLMPFHYRANISRLEQIRVGEKLKPKPERTI